MDTGMLTTMAAWAAVALLVACLGLYAFLRRSLTYWRRRKVAFAPPSVPFGNYADTILGKKSLAMVVHDIYETHRDQRYVGTYFMAMPMLQLHDVDIIRQVFIKEFQDFNGRGMHYDPSYDPLSGHLFQLSGPIWKNMRVKLSPTFTTGKIKYMFSTIGDCNDNLCEHIDANLAEGRGVYTEDIRDLVARLFTDVISSVAFGIESNSLKNPDSEFRRMGARIFEPCLDVNLRHLLIFFGGGIMKTFSIRSVPAHIHDFFTRIVDEMVDHREKNNVERADMLNLLIKLKNDGFVPVDGPGEERSDSQDSSSKQVQKLEKHQIAAQVFVFFLAGFETTSTTTSFTLYELAKNPEIQTKLQQEVDAVLQKCNGKLTYEATQDMHYMDMVIQETLRHYPPVPFLTRQAMVKRQLPLTDVVLDKGMRLMIPVWSIHMDPEYWEDPTRYDPTRFSEEAKSARHPGVYMPFGDGPRICLGMRLGLLQVKMAVASVLSRATVTLAPGMPRQPRFSPRCVLPSPIDGITLTLTARS
ncbi:cytochrome P450 6a2-like [Thrips palmi]|uniref:Cytochrome P450 6a2-like n=1 Tax=Thrips palmi TaxID=161013 RepID=A0A6P9AEH6_THRPL|nr:cytochrome P450 6a2-like [Thrips palmi]